MGCFVEEAQARCSSEEFTHWLAFYSLEPWGDPIDDLRMGAVRSTIANFSGGVKHPTKAEDFMFKLGEQPQKPTLQELKAKWSAIKSATDAARKMGAK